MHSCCSWSPFLPGTGGRWAVQLHSGPLAVGSSPEVTKPARFCWSTHKVFPLFKEKKKKKTHLLQGECQQPRTITSLYCMILRCSGLCSQSPPAPGTCSVFEASLLLYSATYTSGTISNNADINTIEKAPVRLVTPSHWKSLVQLGTPSPFSDLLSSSHVAFVIVLSLFHPPDKGNQSTTTAVDSSHCYQQTGWPSNSLQK